MTTQPVRRAELTLIYNNKDITRHVESMLLSFDFTDVVDGKHTDSISLEFNDSQGYWIDGWFPERGATMEAKISIIIGSNKQTLDCGTFELDEVSFRGPSRRCSLGGIAAGITSSFRRQKKNKAWENFTVQQIAQEITQKNGFTLEFTAGKDDKVDRIDQREQTDIALLTILCERYGLGFYVADKTIGIFDPVQRESQSPVVTFTRNANGYISDTFRVSSADVYKGVQVEYLDPVARDYFFHYYNAESGKWSNEKPPVAYILKVNERCSSCAEAERIGLAALRKENKYETVGSIVLLGSPNLKAGDMAAVSGFGKFDSGTYFIETVKHHYDKNGGYTSVVELRGGLDY